MVIVAQVPPVDIGPFHVGSVVVTLVLAYLAARGLSVLLSLLADRFVEQRLRVKMLIPLSKVVVYVGAVYVILGPILRLSPPQLVAFAGLFGAALGFGLKDVFANAIGGLLIVLTQPYRPGDKVEIGDHYGEVEDIGVRATTLTTPDDDSVSVPNYVSFNEPVSNANAGSNEMMVVVEVHVDDPTDVDRATTILEEALLTSPYVHLSDDHPAVVRVEDRAYYRTLKGKAYVNDLRDEFAFETDVTERTLNAFEAAGIDSPDVDVIRGASP